MLHKVIEYRKITPENLALMSDKELMDGNRRLIDTIEEYKDDVISSGWLTAEDVSEYKSTFRKAEKYVGKEGNS